MAAAVLAIFAVLFVQVHASWLALPDENRIGSGCYWGRVGHMAKDEEKVLQGECKLVYCALDGSGRLLGLGCGVFQKELPNPKCRLVYDYNKPYPKCCIPDIKCGDSNKTDENKS